VAAQEGHLGVVKLLSKELGADINQTSEYGATPLMVAAFMGRLPIVRFLVRKLGADINEAIAGGTAAALSMAMGHNQIKVARWLTKELADQGKVGEEDIVRHVKKDDIISLRRIGSRGIKVSGPEPLSTAALYGHLDVARYLIDELGADVNHTTEDGATPLFLAASAGHMGVVLYLAKEHDVDVNQSDNDGRSPLYVAALNGHLDVVCCLVIELGANVEQADKNGATPLIAATREGHSFVVRTFVKELGANFYHRRKDGRRTLSIAANAGHTRVVMSLVTAHIDEFAVLLEKFLETLVVQLASSVCVAVSKVADNPVVVALRSLR
jgi:ankyrin repeat protein